MQKNLARDGKKMVTEYNEGHYKRPFVFSRAFFAESPRYGAIQTGDSTADLQHLGIATPVLPSLSIAGIICSGADVGECAEG